LPTRDEIIKYMFFSSQVGAILGCGSQQENSTGALIGTRQFVNLK